MFDILYNKTSKPIVTNELLDDFEAFKDLFNQSSLSAEALAEEIGGVDDRIVNYAKTCKNGEMTTRGFSSSLEGMTLKAKAGQVALKGLSLVGNALAGIAVSFVVTSVIKGIDYLINREEKLKESLSDSIEAFESTTSEIKSLDEQVKTLGENIAELQKLKDAGTISIADDEELQKLKEENDELERQIALLQDKQIREGKQVLKDAEKQEDDYVQSRYSLGNKVTPAEELWLGTQSYIYAINSNNDALAKEHGDRVVDMYEKIQPTLEAYRSLEEAGYTLSESEKEHFAELKKGEDAYLMYVYLTNSTKEAFVALNQEMQKSVMLRHLVMEKGMTEEQAGFVLNNIDPEDYENLYGTEFAPPALTDYATAEEYGKAYAEAWLSGIEENVQGSTLAQQSDLSISQTIDNLNTKLKPALDSLSSAYKDIFTSDGFTKENIGVDMLSSVKESITELNEIDGVNIDSSSFEEFARVLSDTSSTSQDIQDQFNSLASTIVYATSSTEISTENFEVLTKVLEEMGLVDARKVLTDIKTAQDEIIAQGYDLTNMTAEQAEQFINEGEVALKTVEYLRMYMIQKELSNNSLSTSNDVSNLENLCNSLGVTGDLLTWVIKLKSALGAVDNGAPIQAFQKQIDEAREKIAELSTSNYGQFQFDFTGDSSTSKAETDYADLLEKETTLLEKQLEAGIITFKEYTDKRKSIIEDYYRQGLISAEDYYSALEDMYDYQLSLYDKVIDAVNYRIDKEIDALEKEKESIEDTYNLRIKSIQTEIDELEKAREKREQQVALEKALYEVEEARRNRDVKLYSGSDRGVIYTNDSKELREAEENLENEKYESHISKLEEQIESLEEEMEKATDAIDEQIDSLSDYADKWSDVADEYEHAQNDMLASQILGANYEEEILNQRMATLEIFKNNYIAAQNAMAEANRKVYETQVGNIGSSGGSSGNGSNGSTNNNQQPTPKAYNTRYKVVVAGAPIKDFGNSYTAKVWMKNNAPSGTIVPYQVPVYAKGGVIGTKKSPLDSIAQSLGEDHLVAGKEGERFLTPVQNEMWEKWTEALPNLQNFANMLQYNIPNYNFDNMIIRNNNKPTPTINIGDIHLHKVNDVDTLSKQIVRSMGNKVLQEIYK